MAKVRNKKKSTPAKQERTNIPATQLACATFVRPSTIELEFVDGLRTSLPIALLGLPLDRIKWSTLKVSRSGDKITVKGIKGDPVPIESSTLRYLVDKKFAVEIDQSLESLQLSREELAEMAGTTPPPDQWYDEPERDLTRASWK